MPGKAHHAFHILPHERCEPHFEPGSADPGEEVSFILSAMGISPLGSGQAKRVLAEEKPPGRFGRDSGYKGK